LSGVKYICAAGATAASLLFGLTFPGLSANAIDGQWASPSILEQSVEFPEPVIAAMNPLDWYPRHPRIGR